MQTNSENFLRELYHIVFAQKKRILMTTLIIFLLALLIALFWPPTFIATGTFIVKGKNAERSASLLDRTVIRTLPVTKEDLTSEVRILTSLHLLTSTAKKLIEQGIVNASTSSPSSSPSFIKSWLLKYFYQNNQDNQEKPVSEADNLARKLFSALKTKVLPASRVIEVKLFWNDPLKAQEILKLLMENHLDYRQEIYNPSNESVFFSGQVNNYFKELADNEQKLLALVQEKKVVDPIKEIEVNLQLWSGLQEQLNLLEKQQIDIEAEVDHLNKALKVDQLQFFSFIENAGIKEFGMRIQDIAIEQARIHKLFKAESEVSKNLERQVDEIYGVLSVEVRGYKSKLENKLEAITKEISLLKNKSAQLSAKNLSLKKLAIKMEEIQRESRLLELSFETYYKRREEANVMQDEQGSGYSAYINILSQAQASFQPFFPRKIQVILMGLLIGFMTGISLGFIREFLDHTFKRPKDVEDMLGLPLIFSISDKK